MAEIINEVRLADRIDAVRSTAVEVTNHLQFAQFDKIETETLAVMVGDLASAMETIARAMEVVAFGECKHCAGRGGTGVKDDTGFEQECDHCEGSGINQPAPDRTDDYD